MATPVRARVLEKRDRCLRFDRAFRARVRVSPLRRAARGRASDASRGCRRAGRMTTGRTVSSVTSGDAFGVGFRRR